MSILKMLRVKFVVTKLVFETLTWPHIIWQKSLDMKNNNYTSATHWKTLREKAGLTQREVSDALGYSTPQFISNVERGRCRFPVQKLPKIKKLYKVSAEHMIELILTEEKQGLLKVFKKAR